MGCPARHETPLEQIGDAAASAKNTMPCSIIFEICPFIYLTKAMKCYISVMLYERHCVANDWQFDWFY